MPRGIYSGIRCISGKIQDFEPTEHQLKTRDMFLKSKFKGMLLYHTLGSGKTCTSILIADTMLKQKSIKKVYVLSSGSLRDGWLGEYCKVCGKKEKYLKKYNFVTYNYNIDTTELDFEDSLVIIDEVHNFINSVRNFTKNATLIYNKLIKQNCRVLALSGTPIYNNINEFALLGTILKPKEFPDIRENGELDTHRLQSLFEFDKEGVITSVKKRSIFEGIISYYAGAKIHTPTVIEMEPIKVQMPEMQEITYWQRFFQEKMSQKHPNKKLKLQNPEKYERLRQWYIMSKKNILTRSASNFVYPDNIPKKISKDVLKTQGGWISKESFEDGKMYKYYSTKFVALFINILLHFNSKHVIFTFFKEKSGAVLLKTLMGMSGITAEIFSGDLSDSGRRTLLSKFNSEKNRYGKVLKVLIITEAGAEGISIKEARHMHILESSNRIGKTIQAIGRIARYKSHSDLPESERNVKIWKYWSMASKEPVQIMSTIIDSEGKETTKVKNVVNKDTIDELLYHKSRKNLNKIESFLKILRDSSF